MNFLAHAWLVSAGSDDFLYGNLIADGVKGRDLSDWPAEIAQGVRHHRRVDAWVDSHPSVANARRRAPVAQRRYAGIALDMLWDHFLARDTAGQADQNAIVERCYRLLSARSAPNRLKTMMPVLVEQDWLRGYADFDFTCRAIAGIGRRLSGPNQLAALVPWLDDDYQALEKDFQTLWPALLAELGHTDPLF
nr:ACP phosphodiesterase [uncultured Halomonas sp.]